MSTSELRSPDRPGTAGQPEVGAGPSGARQPGPTEPSRLVVGGASAGLLRAGARRPYGRLLASELVLVLGRRRNLVLLAILALTPILLGIAVLTSNPGPGSGPDFLFRITENGLFLVFTSLGVTLPLFLPLAVAVASGEAIAGEAASGTLRSLLVVPTGRTRLLAVKYAGVVAFAAASVATVAVVGLVVGLVLFPHGQVTLLSGTAIGYAQALGRAGLICLYVVVMLAAVAAIGVAVSTLTEVPMAAMATVAVLTVVSEIADTLPQLSILHRYLFTDPWLSFGDLLRAPISWGGIEHGVLVSAVYIVIALSLAWARLTTKDVNT